jgi:GDP-mannose 4,6-dehydratase
MRVLITGIAGMVGSHLADYILENYSDVEVHGIITWGSSIENIKHIADKVVLHIGDLTDLGSAISTVKASLPDRIFHLAAQSYVMSSFQMPAATITANVIGTSNLLEAVRVTGIRPRIHVCSSSEVYGQVSINEVPIKETAPFRPASPYAVSKAAADMLAYQYFLSYNMDIIRTRMFTHTGPRRGDVFAESAFAKQIALVEAGKQPNPIKVGNLNSVRTFQDVRDAVKAYWILLEKCPAGEVYNIGGNTTVTIGEILEMLKSMARCPIEHTVDPSLLRPSDVTMQIPDSSKFKQATGWEPEIPLEVTLRDLLNYHRDKVARQL